MNESKIYNLKQIERACIVSSPIAAGILNGVILYPIIKKYQGKQIEKHFENKGEKSSNWNVAGIVVLLVLVIMVPLIVLDQQSPINNFLRADFNGSGVFYNHEISIEEVDKLGNILTRIDYFNSETKHKNC